MSKNNKPGNEIFIYEGGGGESRISVRVENETVWLSQAQMVELFALNKSHNQDSWIITRHASNS